MARFDLTDAEWAVIGPLLPTDVRGKERVDDRRVLNGIFWRLRTGAPWADIPARYGPTIRPAATVFGAGASVASGIGFWMQCQRLTRANLQMIDATSVRVHQHAACAQKKTADPVAWVARAVA